MENYIRQYTANKRKGQYTLLLLKWPNLNLQAVKMRCYGSLININPSGLVLAGSAFEVENNGDVLGKCSCVKMKSSLKEKEVGYGETAAVALHSKQ